MLDNNTYNLMAQLNEEHKSLWRIKKHYLKDSGKSKEAKAFWTKMTKDKENHIKELTVLIKQHLK